MCTPGYRAELLLLWKHAFVFVEIVNTVDIELEKQTQNIEFDSNCSNLFILENGTICLFRPFYISFLR